MKNTLRAKGSRILRNACQELAIKGACKFRLQEGGCGSSTEISRFEVYMRPLYQAAPRYNFLLTHRLFPLLFSEMIMALKFPYHH